MPQVSCWIALSACVVSIAFSSKEQTAIASVCKSQKNITSAKTSSCERQPFFISDELVMKEITVKKSERRYQSGFDVGTGDCHGDDGCDTYRTPRYVTLQFLTITAKTEMITIKNVSLNRGNCSSSGVTLPVTLKFGEEAVFAVTCGVIEAVVETDQGIVTFDWND